MGLHGGPGFQQSTFDWTTCLQLITFHWV